MVKSNLTPAEKQACYQKQNASKIKEWDVQREKAQQAALKENPEQWQEYRARKNERICLLWLKKKIKSRQNKILTLPETDVTWQAPGKHDRTIRRVIGEKEYALHFERSTFYLLADKTTA